MSIEAMKQALEALEYALPFDGANGEIKEAITALRTAIEEAEKQEPLGYWNAVEGWVELPEEAQKPTAWVYPEALEAFQQGQPWTAYGTDGHGPNSDGVERIPLYTTPPVAHRQPLTVRELQGYFLRTNTAEPLAEGWPGLERFARAIEAAHGIKEKNT